MATAKENYKKRKTEIEKRMKQLSAALAKHAEQFKNDDTNWAYVGDLGHVDSVLNELENFVESVK